MTLSKETINGFTVEIDVDYDPISPREDAFNAAGLVMWGRHYDFPNDAGLDLGNFDGWDAVAEHLMEHHGAIWVEPVWVYEHSGIAFKTGGRTYPFDDRWDSAQAGVAYVTRERWQECQGRDWTGTTADRELAAGMVAGDVEVYGQYVNGEVYGYSIIDPVDGEVVDSCMGYYGWEAVTEAAREAAENAEHETKCNGTLDTRLGEVVHDGHCPLHGHHLDEDGECHCSWWPENAPGR